VPTQKPTAVAGQRLVAFLIDALLISAIVVVFWLLLVDKLPKDQVVGDAGFEIGDKRYAFTEENSGKQTLWFLIVGLTAFLLSVVVPSFAGSSPGRAVAGIRVVDEQGRPPGFVKSLVRWLLWIVDGFFFWAVGGILVLATGKNQRLGDMASNTYTVKKELAGQPLQLEQAQSAYPAYAQQGAGAGWHPDPRGEARLRYWDGSQWTEHTSQ
jgi:uncharacterized RDD family membrane protein YckC